jgi:hypothetical protein
MSWREDAVFGQVQIRETLDAEGLVTFNGGLTVPAGQTMVTEGGAVDLESETITLGTGTTDTINMAGLPTEDPEVAGQLWSNEAVVTVSA